MAQEFHDLVVEETVQETAECRSFAFAIPSGLRKRFVYLPGQFVTVEVPIEESVLRRCYSLSSTPDAGTLPTITVKRVAGGRVSPWLLDRVQRGDFLRVSLPQGRFVLRPEDAERPLVLFAAGSGITPIISLLRTALENSSRPVSLIYANRDAESVIFREALRSLQERWGERFECTLHLDDRDGYLRAPAITDLVHRYPGAVHYVCGPAPYMELVEKALLGGRANPADLHFERFVSPTDPDRSRPPPKAPKADGNLPAEWTFQLAGQGRRISYTRGQTLLESVRQAGLKAPSSCEQGYCGSCMAQLVRGRVHMHAHEALSPRDVEEGRILLCQSVPEGDSPLEVDCDATSFRIEPEVSSRGRQTLRRSLGGLLTLFLVAAVCVLRTRH